MKNLPPILTTLLVLLGLALAATPAGTTIQNQASARYIDSANQPRTTTSNEVITVVQQVYDLSITPNGTEAVPGQVRTALPGAQVYFAYTVTNDGNGTDTINLTTPQGTSDNFDLTSTSIVQDNNCDGTVDPGEPTITSVTLGMGASACVIVVGTIPPTATNTQEADINLSGTSAGDEKKTDEDNWATAIATTTAALDMVKSASPTGLVTPGATITYTLSGQNRGGSAASGVPMGDLKSEGILISDVIPSGLTVTTSLSNPSGTAGAGTVQMVYSADGIAWTTTLPASITGDGIQKIGMLIVGTGAFFPQNAQYTFSFQAAVPAAPPAGATYHNTGTIAYDANGDGDATDPGETKNSNTTLNNVGGTYAVAIGGTVATAADGTDTQTIDTAVSGSTVIFHNTLQNTGNTSDSFNLSLSGSTLGVCLAYQSDGTTPISGPVGPLAAGAIYDVIVKCSIPPTQTITGSVSLTATSVNNPSGTTATLADGVDDTVLSVKTITSGFGVDAAAQGSTTDTPGVPAIDDSAETANDTLTPPAAINPGSTVSIPFSIQNAGSNPDTYNFSATLPSGWTVTFYPDAKCDGVADTESAPITNSGLVEATGSDIVCVVAVVEVPVGSKPGTSPVTITSTSTTLPSASDSVRAEVTVNTMAGFVFDPDRSGTVTSPGTITYTHNLSNDGNTDCAVSIPAPTSAYGWVYQFSTDGGTTWTSSVSGYNISPASTGELQVRVIVPGGEPIGRTEAVTLNATADYGSGIIASDSATDTTTVVGGDLRLTKSVDKTTALPGENLVYTILAENIGTADLKEVIVSDPLPAYTNFVSLAVSKPSTGTVMVSNNGTGWKNFGDVDTDSSGSISAAEWANATTGFGSAMIAGGVVYVGVDTNADSNITNADLMAPAANITVTFTVQVQ